MTTQRDEFFPDSERVLYARSPLLSVICQWRFPTILRIESQPPADFQDSIRGQFPVLQRSQPGGMEQLPPDVVKLLGAAVGQQRDYHFRSEDETTTITLGPSGLAVTTSRYDRWEEFEEKLRLAFETLVRVYGPSYLTRIGLRYQNAIDRAQIEMVDMDWAELISDNIVGEFRHNFGGRRIVEAHRHLRVLDQATSEGILLQHGLGTYAEGNTAYLIDIDCYTEKRIEVSDALSYLQRFNHRAGRAFRWCISDRTHAALLPQSVGDVAAR